jgi:hypothetical protein
MRTTVVHRRPLTVRGDITMPCSRPIAITHPRPVLRRLPSNTAPAAPWSTAKLGVVVSTLAALAALLVDATTELPSQAIVLAVMVVAFAVSCHATARRPVRFR